MNAGDPFEWYNEIPIVSRIYLTLSFVTTAACALDLVSPFSLYFNYRLIVDKGQVHDSTFVSIFVRCLGVRDSLDSFDAADSTSTSSLIYVQIWRLFTNFFFFGMFSVDFLFHMYFLVRYSRLLEDGHFRGRTADFVFMLSLGATAMLVRGRSTPKTMKTRDEQSVVFTRSRSSLRTAPS